MDAGQSIVWLQRASDQGYSLALYELGRLYENGVNVAQDYGRALKLYQLASNSMFVPALLALSKMYSEGRGVKPNLQTAFMWSWLAGHRGNAEGKQLAQSLEPQLNKRQVEAAMKEAREHISGRLHYR